MSIRVHSNRNRIFITPLNTPSKHEQQIQSFHGFTEAAKNHLFPPFSLHRFIEFQRYLLKTRFLAQLKRKIANATLEVPEAENAHVGALVRDVQVKLVVQPINRSWLIVTHHSFPKPRTCF